MIEKNKIKRDPYGILPLLTADIAFLFEKIIEESKTEESKTEESKTEESKTEKQEILIDMDSILGTPEELKTEKQEILIDMDSILGTPEELQAEEESTKQEKEDSDILSGTTEELLIPEHRKEAYERLTKLARDNPQTVYLYDSRHPWSFCT